MPLLGTCPVCNRLYTLTEKGTLPDHLEKANGRQSRPPCQGVGQGPFTEK
jgi:hypothetical protein